MVISPNRRSTHTLEASQGRKRECVKNWKKGKPVIFPLKGDLTTAAWAALRGRIRDIGRISRRIVPSGVELTVTTFRSRSVAIRAGTAATRARTRARGVASGIRSGITVDRGLSRLAGILRNTHVLGGLSDADRGVLANIEVFKLEVFEMSIKSDGMASIRRSPRARARSWMSVRTKRS